MKKSCGLTLALIFLMSCGTSNDESSLNIIGGVYGESNQALKGSFPSSVSFVILSSDGGSCSATRIAENRFVTAAHCFSKGVEDVNVSMGTSNGLLFNFSLTKLSLHPSYTSILSKVTTASDIATFSIRFKTVSEKKLFDAFVTVAPINFVRPSINEELTVTGFGCEKINSTFVADYPWVTASNCLKNNTRRVIKIAKSQVETVNTFSAPFSERYFTLLGEIGSRSDGYIAPGDSGGGVFNASGQLVGVNAQMFGVDGLFLRTLHASVAFPDARRFIESSIDSAVIWQDGRVTIASDGESYAGFMLKGVREGEGTQNFKDGKTYTGQWHNDVRTGFGRQIWPSGAKYISYDGQWENDLPNGEGILSFTEGFVYTGELVDGKLSGKGSMKFPNGDVREGRYVSGKREGDHILVEASGRRYLESYLNDQRTSVTAL